LWKVVTRQLGLSTFLASPGDDRPQPQIPAQAWYWSMLIGQLLRECSFPGVESLVCSSARQALKVSVSFGDDAAGSFTEQLNAEATRHAAAQVVRRAKRNKASDDSAWIGLAIDGATNGRCQRRGCKQRRPVGNRQEHIAGYRPNQVVVIPCARPSSSSDCCGSAWAGKWSSTPVEHRRAPRPPALSQPHAFPRIAPRREIPHLQVFENKRLRTYAYRRGQQAGSNSPASGASSRVPR
jgi:hypothetical protein